MEPVIDLDPGQDPEIVPIGFGREPLPPRTGFIHRGYPNLQDATGRLIDRARPELSASGVSNRYVYFDFRPIEIFPDPAWNRNWIAPSGTPGARLPGARAVRSSCSISDRIAWIAILSVARLFEIEGRTMAYPRLPVGPRLSPDEIARRYRVRCHGAETTP